MKLPPDSTTALTSPSSSASSASSASLLPFPAAARAARARREHALRVAAAAAPLLAIAVAEGNASLVEKVFTALGAYSSGRAYLHLEQIRTEDAQVVKLG